MRIVAESSWNWVNSTFTSSTYNALIINSSPVVVMNSSSWLVSGCSVVAASNAIILQFLSVLVNASSTWTIQRSSISGGSQSIVFLSARVAVMVESGWIVAFNRLSTFANSSAPSAVLCVRSSPVSVGDMSYWLLVSNAMVALTPSDVSPIFIDSLSALTIGNTSWVLWASNNMSSPNNDTCVIFQGPLDIRSNDGYMSVIGNNCTSMSMMWRNASGQATASSGAGSLFQRCNRLNASVLIIVGSTSRGGGGLPLSSISLGGDGDASCSSCNAPAECFASLTNTSQGCSLNSTSGTAVCTCTVKNGRGDLCLPGDAAEPAASTSVTQSPPFSCVRKPTLTLLSATVSSSSQPDGIFDGAIVHVKDVQGPLNIMLRCEVNRPSSSTLAPLPPSTTTTVTHVELNLLHQDVAIFLKVGNTSGRLNNASTLSLITVGGAVSTEVGGRGVFTFVGHLDDSLGVFAAEHPANSLNWNVSAVIAASMIVSSGRCQSPFTNVTAPLAFSLTVMDMPLQPPAPAPVVASATLATTQTAVAVSVAAAAVSGPGSAADLQSMVLVTLARCSVTSTGTASSSGGYMLLTPFALSDTARGALAGNAVAFTALLLLQLVVFTVGRLRATVHADVMDSLAAARLPGYLLLMAASLHQSTLFSAIRLIGSDGTGPIDSVMGVFALLFSLSIPVGVGFAAAKVPRRFVRYTIQPGSLLSQRVWLLVSPSGTTLPERVRLSLGSVVTSFQLSHPMFTSIFFASSIVTNIVSMMPQASPRWLCAGVMYVSAAIHIGLAALVAFTGMYRFPTNRVLNAVGLVLTAVFHAQIASAWREGIDAVLTLQAGLSLFRSLVALANAMIERKLQNDRSNVELGKVMWIVGNGGLIDDKGNAGLVVRGNPADLEMALLVPPTAVGPKQEDDPFGSPSTHSLLPDNGVRLDSTDDVTAPVEERVRPEANSTTSPAHRRLSISENLRTTSLGETDMVKETFYFGGEGNQSHDILRSFYLSTDEQGAERQGAIDDEDSELL